MDLNEASHTSSAEVHKEDREDSHGEGKGWEVGDIHIAQTY